MCVLFLHYQPEDPTFPYLLIAANNRDELFQRQTTAAGFWEDHPNVLAGLTLYSTGSYTLELMDYSYSFRKRFRQRVVGWGNRWNVAWDYNRWQVWSVDKLPLS